ncbi:hypothetical protein EJ02DRAFT_459193 [Clathrospora elynae]|uniref:Uncharacterized protein n=1 Tax=Clathrospora elynae TaxID=706981 RepID=A0A6A5SA86_9PLEO|nr:hypothetical protein EJ02DRAFT_459193 [Clathrospora elynae]
MNPASLSSALSPRNPRSSLRTLVLYYMQALCKEVVLLSTRIAKMGNLLHSTAKQTVLSVAVAPSRHQNTFSLAANG